MLKILLFIDSLGSGGAQRQMVGLAKLLLDRGYQIKVIYYHSFYFFRAILDKNYIESEYVSGASNKGKLLFKINHSFKQYKPDVVISFIDGPNIIACLLKLIGFKYNLITSERNTTQIINFRERLKFLLLRNADAIVANSFSQEAFIKRKYPDLLDKTCVITNFVDTDVFQPCADIKREEKKEILRIICVARVHTQKNVLLFLDALNCLKKEGHLFLVDWFGYKEEPYYTQCVSKIHYLQLENVFTFREPTESIVQEYQKADVFCLPSIYEGFPNVVCEAMSCGLPVLCSNVCDNPMIVRDHDNGLLFDPNDVNDIVAKFKAFFNLSVEEKIRMGKQSRVYAEHDFSKESFVEKYVQLIESLVK